jgi:hypothetical protein
MKHVRLHLRGVGTTDMLRIRQFRSPAEEACMAAIVTATADSTTIHKAFLRICIRNSLTTAPRSPRPGP